MAIKKEDLILRGELLLQRLQKEHRNIRKAYKLKDADEVDVVARLVVAYQLLTGRIANEAIIYATNPPEISLSKEELADKRAKVKEINEMLTMTSRIRDLSKDLVNEALTGFGARTAEVTDEKIAYIQEAKKELDDLGFSFDAIQVELDSVKCIEKQKAK